MQVTPHRLSIIGSARPPSVTQPKRIWDACVSHVLSQIERIPGPVIINSGGAAWSDQLAIVAWNHYNKSIVITPNIGMIAPFIIKPDISTSKIRNFTLALPTPFIETKTSSMYFDNGKSDWKTNPGKLANSCHRSFSSAVYDDPDRSMRDITVAIAAGATVKVYSGFHERNIAIAHNCDTLLVYGSTKEPPLTGGTAHTMKQAHNRCRIDYISYDDVIVPSHAII